jgi:hypothetical protein
METCQACRAVTKAVQDDVVARMEKLEGQKLSDNRKKNKIWSACSSVADVEDDDVRYRMALEEVCPSMTGYVQTGDKKYMKLAGKADALSDPSQQRCPTDAVGGGPSAGNSLAGMKMKVDDTLQKHVRFRRNPLTLLLSHVFPQLRPGNSAAW